MIICKVPPAFGIPRIARIWIQEAQNEGTFRTSRQVCPFSVLYQSQSTYFRDGSLFANLDPGTLNWEEAREGRILGSFSIKASAENDGVRDRGTPEPRVPRSGVQYLIAY